MIIRLQANEQITLFWDMIRQCMIESNQVPKKFQQDYAINALERLLSGMLQAWVIYKEDENKDKRIHAILVSKIIDEKYYGIKILNAEALYGHRFIDDELIDEMFTKTEEFAKANGCNVMAADFSITRVKEILTRMGFREHRTICRKFIS